MLENAPVDTLTNRIATAVQTPAKGARRPRQPVPKYRTPRAAARRFNAIVLKLLGGRTEPSVVEREMARQAAAVMLRAEQLQAELVRGEAVDPLALIRTTSELRRALRALGVKTEPEKPVGPPAGLEIARARWAEAEERERAKKAGAEDGHAG
jgi:hypothetical protein